VPANAIKALKNAQQSNLENGNTWKLTSNNIEALQREIMQFALDQHLNIAQMQAETHSLEDVFRKLTN